MTLHLRELTPQEPSRLEKLAHSRTAPAQTVERARILGQASHGQAAPAIAAELRLDGDTVGRRLHRFNAEGLNALEDQPRSGRPATYSPEQVAAMIAAALTKPEALGRPFACWTLDRLTAYLNEQKGIAIRRSRLDEILIREGLRWRRQDTWFGERGDPAFADKSRLRGQKGKIETLYTAPPAGSVVICLDEMGPVSAKSYPGREPLRTKPAPVAGRAKQEIDYGRRGKGYIFGAFRPATGEAFSHSYGARNSANWVDFLERVEIWLPDEAERVSAIADNLSAHRATDVLLCPAVPARSPALGNGLPAEVCGLFEPGLFEPD